MSIDFGVALEILDEGTATGTRAGEPEPLLGVGMTAALVGSSPSYISLNNLAVTAPCSCLHAFGCIDLRGDIFPECRGIKDLPSQACRIRVGAAAKQLW